MTNTPYPINSEENTEPYTNPHDKHMKTRMKSDRHTCVWDVKEHFPVCFLVDLWPWPNNHYSCCVILECNNKYKLLLSLPQNSVSLHCHTTKSCRETTKFHIPGIKSSNDNRCSSTLCRDCRERTLLGFLRQYEILHFQTKFQKKKLVKKHIPKQARS